MQIASRVLILTGSTKNVEVPVRVFLPKERDGTWTCRYEIDWPGRKWSHAADGHDAMQALVLALQMIGAVIYTSEYHRSGKLVWGASGEGYGFPVPNSSRDLLVGNDKRFL